MAENSVRRPRTPEGRIVISSNGVSIPASYTGTYTLNANCTGIKSATLNIGLTVTFYFVVAGNLREIRDDRY